MGTAIVTLLVMLVIIGLVVWLIDNYAPIDAGIKGIIRFLAIAIAVILIIRFLLTLANINLF